MEACCWQFPLKLPLRHVTENRGFGVCWWRESNKCFPPKLPACYLFKFLSLSLLLLHLLARKKKHCTFSLKQFWRRQRNRRWFCMRLTAVNKIKYLSITKFDFTFKSLSGISGKKTCYFWAYLDSITHEQTIICRQLFPSHVVGSGAMKKNKYLFG